MEQGREAIAHRLIALGRAHDLLLQTSWTSASLPAIVRAAIGPFDTPGAERFVVQGAEINVGPAAVLSLALALNELCTNAVKYGALSNAEGHVEITSVLDEKAQRFKLIWAEKGGPAVKESPKRGFGMRLGIAS
jgi:two-component sensor histidine kinase